MANELKIGIFADSLRLPVRDGLQKARELGVEYFQMFTTAFEFAYSDEFLPEHLTPAQRSEFRDYYHHLGLTLSATCADFGHGFTDADANVALIPRMFSQIDLAVDLGTRLLTTHIGLVPDTPDAVWETLRTALNAIGGYAENRGVVLAAETGPESGPVLRALLETLDTPAIRVNFDPANLVMAGFDLDEALDALLPYIVHTHAKDGLRDPEAWAQGRWQEMPLGSGDVPWQHYLQRLRTYGYTGVYAIERELGEHPVADIEHAIAFLRGLD